MESPPTWQVVKRSVMGPTHARLSLPNQDRIESVNGLETLVAVSDGHGSAKCFRSHIGAKFAVETAIEVLLHCLKSHSVSAESSFTNITHSLRYEVPREIAKTWKERVEKHHDAEPFTVNEIERLASLEGLHAAAKVSDNPVLAYGATILGAGMTRDLILFFQLGDGDVLTVSEFGETSRPLAGDDRNFANQTTSLSAENAWVDFRTSVRSLGANAPSLILIATDGYSNSFKDDAGFLQAGTDFLALLNSENGIQEVEKHLDEWLAESAQKTGDDVTIGLLYRGASHHADLLQ